jgi:hypothetical protein
MKIEAINTLKGGLIEARKELGEELQEWFRQKYFTKSRPTKDRVYTQASSIPKGKIYFAINDNKTVPKKGYYDVYPIVFHLEAVPYKNVDQMLFGLNLNYWNSSQRAMFIDAIAHFFQRYIDENHKRLENSDYTQMSMDGLNDFVKGYIGNMGLNVSKTRETYVWSKLRITSVVPIDYEDWKWLPLLVPFGVIGDKSLSQIQSL